DPVLAKDSLPKELMFRIAEFHSTNAAKPACGMESDEALGERTAKIIMKPSKSVSLLTYELLLSGSIVTAIVGMGNISPVLAQQVQAAPSALDQQSAPPRPLSNVSPPIAVDDDYGRWWV